MSWFTHFYPLILLITTILLTLFVKLIFEEQYLISPYVSSDFNIRAVEIIKEQPVEVVETVTKTQREQITDYIIEVFENDAVEAIVIIRKCENSQFNPTATNWNRNGTWDTGIFQINEIHGYTLEQMQDWRQNIDAAKKIFDRAGDWSPWSCSHVVGVTPFYLK